MFGWPRNPGPHYQGWESNFNAGNDIYGGPGPKPRGPGARMMNPGMNKVGNQTNNNDPSSVGSRVFAGNLNTYIVNRDQVERMFAPYGRVAGISMHKGYAFVQFTNPYDARNAVQAMDSRVICGQVLDCNLVNEPKAHQSAGKRQNAGSGDWAQKGPANKKARVEGGRQKAEGEPDAFLCFMCKDKFTLSWELLHHIQGSHNITLYEEISADSKEGTASQGGDVNGANQTS